ncbi:MAG TPA: DNA mismatch repair protein MutT, partial [Firmicutes bacterium]|nr:DNA mismatch repair protein MutT [Bacillota bacterium]
MKKEKSVGAVIYRIGSDGKREYLVQKMNLGHVSICKGHVEGSETEVETAAREIMEETGLKVDIDTRFRHVVT